MMSRRRAATLFPYTTLFRSIPMGEAIPKGEIQGNGGAARGPAAYLLLLRVEQSEGEPATYALPVAFARSEEHTSELQSQSNLVCRLLLEKKKTCRREREGSPPQRSCMLLLRLRGS